MTFSRTISITRGLEEYEVTVDFKVTSWGDPGVYSGPPEHCYPAEGPEFEFLGVFAEPPAWARDRYPAGMPFALTSAELLEIEESIYADPPEDNGPDPDDERDRRYDESRYDIGNGIGGDNREEDF
jgi:hypothetical protein